MKKVSSFKALCCIWMALKQVRRESVMTLTEYDEPAIIQDHVTILRSKWSIFGWMP
jgi:hypothetical protein